ncbi:UDP-4-amino-4,6-dideoxy-N-acetyl-beta-L-altrosamine transaminase [Ferribacterium limneticum]|uniref:UDP-4-amino-4, 6-dideoxy-N-acetyl-beta-L-altrosamine transaminase n=1 Tax=Ferribacterium limneticum TaxID=76259 RepID=UPI001CF9A531|nr:UDP-4-amino-4,6-dideoxy-N-acetyl-beta-L-altrosamine transaminase [Ferribacterium limneticum]UCV27631.1 UDP-4-amino-4,6-dideoxy-N-acetyl-beta-L-altrosamine transaminase [Ferribacterium limneticum]UCV31548.1 UDP-4-amino-4,6-dideoxy-N-acetyl-beta-L-altrosamine transaminase [Ferribacterium limneticum]
MIPYGRQSIDDADIESVVAVLRSAWLTQGPVVPALEGAFARRCEVNYAVAVSNATAALHLACTALGVRPGDHVWTSPNSFVASANCAHYCGATADFVDIDPVTLNLSIANLEAKLKVAAAQRKLPKVIIPVHFSGRTCDMAAIAQLGQHYGFRIIEDASHAVGALYDGEPVGNCLHSDITIFSFHPVKIITTGEGGMALTNDPAIATHLQRLRSHGITRDQDLMPSPCDGPWHYQQIELGFNYRLTDIQAALGLSQLRRLDEFLARRRYLAHRYAQMLDGLPVRLPIPNNESAWHLYPVRVDAVHRRAIFETMQAAGIGVQVHYIPIHLQPYFRQRGFNPGDFPAAEAYYSEAISLPIYPALTEGEQDKVCVILRRALGA